MKATDGVIDVVDTILSADLMAINQYCVHAKLCEHWGFERLQQKVRARSIDVMKDADRLTGHILYLEDVPKVHRMRAVHPGETVPEQLKFDLKAEQPILTLLSGGMRHCTKVSDNTNADSRCACWWLRVIRISVASGARRATGLRDRTETRLSGWRPAWRSLA